MSPWRPSRTSGAQPRPRPGFTLIELLVVVLIIGILAAIALPRFLGQRTRAKNAAAQAAVRHALVAARSYYTQNSESYAGLGTTQLQGYESSLGSSEPADNQTPGSGANPQNIWIGNGITGTNPAAGDVYSGKTVVLCSVSRGDTTYCIRDTDGVASYGQLPGSSVTVASGAGQVTSGWNTNFHAGLLLVSGGHSACAVGSDSRLRCWGGNGYGQLSDGTTTNSTTPLTINLSNVIGTAGAGNALCALIQGGTVQCWGRNNYGQLGDGTTTDRTTPAAVSNLSGVSALTGGTWHFCALLSDGTAQCWGYNYGQLGDSTTTQRSAPVVVQGLTGASQISAGDFQTCALISGAVRCWGWNTYGQLGTGNTTGINTASGSNAISSGAVQIATGGVFACALMADGTVRCWGQNTYGPVGDGTTNNALSPVEVPGVSGAVQVVTGYYFACALIQDGTVRCWGRNDYGQLGNSGLGVGGQSNSPVQVSGVSGAAAISNSYGSVCARWPSGTVRCWGRSYTNAQTSDTTALGTLAGP